MAKHSFWLFVQRTAVVALMILVTAGLAFGYFLMFTSGIRMHMLTDPLSWSRPAGMVILLLGGLFVVSFTIYASDTYMREVSRGGVALYRRFLTVTGLELMILPFFHIFLVLVAAIGPFRLGLQPIDVMGVVGAFAVGWAMRKRARGLNIPRAL